jgi:hypothetical protein
LVWNNVPLDSIQLQGCDPTFVEGGGVRSAIRLVPVDAVRPFAVTDEVPASGGIAGVEGRG